VAQLLSEKPMELGYDDEVWRGTDARGLPVSSGLYFFRPEAGEAVVTGKLMLLK
jgi:hypothetical protein